MESIYIPKKRDNLSIIKDTPEDELLELGAIIDHKNKNISLTNTQYTIRKNLILPKGYKLTIKGPTTINMSENNIIYVRGSVNFENNVLFTSNSYWRGIFVDNAKQKSTISDTTFSRTDRFNRL